MIYKILNTILVLLFISSCATDFYGLNKDRLSSNYLEGYRGDNPLKVEIIADDVIEIKEDAMTSLRRYEITQYHLSFILKKIKGNSINIYQRTSPLDIENNKGIRIEMNEDNIKFYEDEHHLYTDDFIGIKNGEENIIRITQDADLTEMIINCDTVFSHKSKLPSAEYLIIKTDPETKAMIYSPEINDINEDNGGFFNLSNN